MLWLFMHVDGREQLLAESDRHAWSDLLACGLAWYADSFPTRSDPWMSSMIRL
jgi:hypothetical protein